MQYETFALQRAYSYRMNREARIASVRQRRNKIAGEQIWPPN